MIYGVASLLRMRPLTTDRAVCWPIREVECPWVKRSHGTNDVLPRRGRGTGKSSTVQCPARSADQRPESAEALAELKTSIERHGVLQPVLFRKDEQGQYILISGERRFRSSQLAGQETLPCIYNEGGSSAEIALVENLLRENLNPIEEAEALQQLKQEQSYTNEQISAVIGKAVDHFGDPFPQQVAGRGQGCLPEGPQVFSPGTGCDCQGR